MLMVFSRRKRCPSQGVGPSVAHHRLGGQKFCGLRRESNPGPLAPEARIIPLDHEATMVFSGDGNFSLHGPMPAAQPVQRRDATCVAPAGAQHRAGRACRRAARPRCWCARRLAAPETLRPPRALGTAPYCRPESTWRDLHSCCVNGRSKAAVLTPQLGEPRVSSEPLHASLPQWRRLMS